MAIGRAGGVTIVPIQLRSSGIRNYVSTTHRSMFVLDDILNSLVIY